MRRALIILCLVVICLPVHADWVDWLAQTWNSARAAWDEATLIYRVLRAADYEEPRVMSFARRSVSYKHAGDYSIAQVCDVFDAVSTRWTYVNDPNGFEYIQRASDSLSAAWRGDCDDHAVFMASCMQSIGGAAFVLLAMWPEGGHAIPMLYVGQTFYDASKRILYIADRYSIKVPPVYELAWGYWLNLDYTADHPGGPMARLGPSQPTTLSVPLFDVDDANLYGLPAPAVP